jgi:hypothetical protein
MSRNPLFDLQQQIKEEDEQLERSIDRVAEELRAYCKDIKRYLTRGEFEQKAYEKWEELTPELDEIRRNERARFYQMLRKEDAQSRLPVFCLRHIQKVRSHAGYI